MAHKMTVTGGNFNVTAAPRAGLLGSVTATVLKWQERAAMRYHLQSMDEEFLNDTGMTSQTLRAEATKPFWRQ
ncbi:MAG: hypothetical protein EP348_01700 [Alphaproteobacteria bacterium]|nr:MAG: hypothetical protein EP348_01700 [Alphaproteobacteria bacterium]